MELKKLLTVSLLILPFSLLAENAADYAHRGAQKYIFGDEDGAKAEVAAGLAKFPNDRELQQMVGLFPDKKSNSRDQRSQKQKQQQQQQNSQNQDQQQSSQQNQ